MSLFLEKAIDSLGTLFSPLGTNANLKQMFERCLRARTWKEEERLIQECLHIVKHRLKEPSNNLSLVTRGLAFVAFAEMLGYKSDFAHIHAVNMAQFGSLYEKKIDPLAVMVLNTILRDLASKNVLVVAMAISASCHLIPMNLASTILPILAEKLNHPSEYVRSKAVIAFHHFLRLCPEYCFHYVNGVCALLGDKDPDVVGYVLQFLLEATKVGRGLIIQFVPVLLNIQRQILTDKLSDAHKYRGFFAPWMQITLLKLLQCSQEYTLDIATVTQDTLHTVKKTGGSAILEALKIECFTTIILCKGDENNLNSAMVYVGELLTSTSCNLRFAGLDLLETIIRHCQWSLLPEQQQIVLSCLENADPMIKRKALRLLCVAANEKNVELVCSQVAAYLYLGCGGNVRFELVKDAVNLTDKFPNTSNYWHVAMLIRLLPLADSMQSKLILQKIKASLLSEEDHNVVQARHKVLRILRKYSKSKTAATCILELFVWTLSNFGINCEAANESDSEIIIEEIVRLGRKILKHQVPDNSLSPAIDSLLVSMNDALMHIVHQYGITSGIVEYIEEVKSVALGNSYLHEYCIEILHTLPHAQELHRCWKNMDWYKDVEGIDLTLSFLDWYVCESLKRGENPYQPKLLKPVASDGVVSSLDSECTMFSRASSSKSSSSVCASPVSVEKDFLVPSLSTEDFKFCLPKSSGRETGKVQAVWTKTGRLTDIDRSDGLSGSLHRDDVGDSPENVGEAISNEDSSQGVLNNQSVRNKEWNVNVPSNHDPLETLLNEDFQKLSVNSSKS